jgi:hypothetical protein
MPNYHLLLLYFHAFSAPLFDTLIQNLIVAFSSIKLSGADYRDKLPTGQQDPILCCSLLEEMLPKKNRATLKTNNPLKGPEPYRCNGAKAGLEHRPLALIYKGNNTKPMKI